MSDSVASSGLSALPLQSLAAIALDTETTGLDPSSDRIVQIGAVRLSAGRLDDVEPFQMLVNPGIAIPASSTAIHHIADRDVAGAGGFASVMDQFTQWSRTPLVIGYAIGFDLAVLQAEHARHGLPWRVPRSLDVRHLVQVLSPNLPDTSLDLVAAWLGIKLGPRHRALEDALSAARIFLALVPKLRERGIVTLAQAERACLGLSSQLAEEAQAGWQEIIAAGRLVPESVTEYARIDSFPYRHRVADVMTTPPVTIGNDVSMQAALALMMKRQVSSVFLPPDRPGNSHGIVTERDVLRAVGTDGPEALAAPVGRYAVRPLVSIDSDEFIYRAMGIMSAKGFRHLGVASPSGALVGALSARDLLRQRAGDALSIGEGIDNANTPEELGRVWSGLTSVARGLVYEDVDPFDIAAVISRELRALTRRACEIAEREMADAGNGEPPIPYAVLVLGSGGRGESLLAMDQDNAIIYEKGEPGGAADRWFEQLGKRMSDILNGVGVAYCKGGIMAANAEWRRDLDSWRKTISQWIGQPKSEALLNADIFFDNMPVHGEMQMGEDLREEAIRLAGTSRPFQARLALNAVVFRPPVGLFGRFKTENGRIDLKKGGIMPLFATARTLALKFGIAARSTPERFEAVRNRLQNSAEIVTGLIEAHRILLDTILRQQLRDLEAGIALSNKVAPGALSSQQRMKLRWALKQVPSVSVLLGTPLFG
jgi:CBS domain-containing protein